MSEESTPGALGSNDQLEYADKLRALLFGMRDSDPGCTVSAEYCRVATVLDDPADGRAQCSDCYGKGWNGEWKAVSGHYNGGEVFRIECEPCDGSGFSTLTPEFMQAQADEAPDLTRGA